MNLLSLLFKAAFYTLRCPCPDNWQSCAVNFARRTSSGVAKTFPDLLCRCTYGGCRCGHYGRRSLVAGSMSGSCVVISIGSGNSVGEQPGFGSQGVPGTLCSSCLSCHCSCGTRLADCTTQVPVSSSLDTNTHKSHLKSISSPTCALCVFGSQHTLQNSASPLSMLCPSIA